MNARRASNVLRACTVAGIIGGATWIGGSVAPKSVSAASTGAVYVAECSATGHHCNLALLSLINQDRATKHLAPLKFDRTQAQGTSECIGARGKVKILAGLGTLWHTNRHFPKASFPQNICGTYRFAGENIGYSFGNRMDAIREVQSMMIDEGPHGGHYQNLMSRQFDRVGLWITQHKGAWFVVEDFLA
jgi:uncharacterized protein YkwD